MIRVQRFLLLLLVWFLNEDSESRILSLEPLIISYLYRPGAIKPMLFPFFLYTTFTSPVSLFRNIRKSISDTFNCKTASSTDMGFDGALSTLMFSSSSSLLSVRAWGSVCGVDLVPIPLFVLIFFSVCLFSCFIVLSIAPSIATYISSASTDEVLLREPPLFTNISAVFLNFSTVRMAFTSQGFLLNLVYRSNFFIFFNM